jgi:hypothetical protein
MNTKTTLKSLAALSLANMLGANVLAGPDRATSPAIESSAKAQKAHHRPSVAPKAAPVTKSTREPRRIFDLESRNFVPNPDYHGPSPLR